MPLTNNILLLLSSAAAVGLLGGTVLLMRAAGRPKFTWTQRFVYAYGRVVARFFWRARVSGPLPVEETGGALIICNHRGPFDPAIVQLATQRQVHWMVAREYCERPVLRWFFDTVGSIPTNRGGVDTAAIRQVLRYARKGELVGMLPEGRINTTDQVLLSGRPGIALVALKTRVPVIPCFVTGSPYSKTIVRSMFTFTNARLTVGEPIDLSPYHGREKDKEVLEEVTRLLLKSIASLAGEEDFEPQIAGRNWKPEGGEL